MSVLNGVVWCVRMFESPLWWVVAIFSAVLRWVYGFLHVCVVEPVEIAVWNWLQLVTLPLNVFLKVTVGVTWPELLRDCRGWFNKYVVVTILQYTASVAILGMTLGAVGGVSLALFHYYARVPSYYVEIPLRFWRLPGYLYSNYVRPRLPDWILSPPSVATIRQWVRDLLFEQEQPQSGSIITPPSTPKYSPYDKALFLRDFYPDKGASGYRRPASTSEVNTSQVHFTPNKQKLEVESMQNPRLGLSSPDPEVTSKEPKHNDSADTSVDSSNVWDEFDTIPSVFEDDTDRLTTVTNRKQKQSVADMIQISRMK